MSARAQRVDKPVADETVKGAETPAATLQQPRRIDGAKRSVAKAAPAKKKKSFWRKLWVGMQIGVVVTAIVGCLLGYFDI